MTEREFYRLLEEATEVRTHPSGRRLWRLYRLEGGRAVLEAEGEEAQARFKEAA
ncbi:hypothetical protein [Thermus tengchongensis]|uniref:hypothetical protein n=1 Tax=Thermus tengchongensis TaxID=1214928 RepID=UPI000B1C87AE|nr:hypothetical protein [Thermus tengchongensis]